MHVCMMVSMFGGAYVQGPGVDARYLSQIALLDLIYLTGSQAETRVCHSV